jgi:cell division protein FtsB
MTISHRSLSQREKPYKEQIELLESLNKSYSQQIAELHSSKEMLLKQLRENTKFSNHNRSGFFSGKITRT